MLITNYLVLFLGTFLSATVIPFSSEFMLSGMLVAGGSLPLSIAVASIGLCWLPLVGDVIAVVLGLLRLSLHRVIPGMLLGKTFRYLIWALFSLELISCFSETFPFGAN